MRWSKTWFWGLVISVCLFLPAFNTFFTNDDFFHLKISHATNPAEFIGFFNPVSGPEGLGLYRPLTTQVYYWISVNFFRLSPVPLRIISFIFLVIISGLVLQLTYLVTQNRKAAGFAGLLYLLSAVHFGHMYYAGTFQELGMTCFFLLSVIYLWKFLSRGKKGYYLLSLAGFVLALLSKETAVMLPLTLLFLSAVFYRREQQTVSGRNLLKLLVPFFLILGGYAYLRIRFYGFATGDSYIWSLSPRVFNTAIWYLLWSLGLPEMLVDFIGSGLTVNPNLVRFWGSQISAILTLWTMLLVWVGYLLRYVPGHRIRYFINVVLFAGGWFLLTLGPLLFLPWHKFAYNLTLPLAGAVILPGLLLASVPKTRAVIFIGIYLLLSAATLDLTVKTHWITRGEATAGEVNKYVNQNLSRWPMGETLVFYDAPTDKDLPWSPAEVIKNVLSGNNYFEVFTQGKVRALYLPQEPVKIITGQTAVAARQFLGY